MPSTKALQEQLDDQQEVIDQASEILEEAYTPEATRTELVAAVSEALDILSGEESESDDDVEEDGDDLGE